MNLKPLVIVLALLTQQPAIAGSIETDQKRVQSRLKLIHELLQGRDTSHLSINQKAARRENLKHLKDYAERGRYPINSKHAGFRVPYFIDHQGTACAVGYLMIQGGDKQLAQRIAETQNNEFLEKIQVPGIQEWITRSGLTPEELKLVQPAYEHMHRNQVEHWEREYNHSKALREQAKTDEERKKFDYIVAMMKENLERAKLERAGKPLTAENWEREISYLKALRKLAKSDRDRKKYDKIIAYAESKLEKTKLEKTKPPTLLQSLERWCSSMVSRVKYSFNKAKGKFTSPSLPEKGDKLDLPSNDIQRKSEPLDDYFEKFILFFLMIICPGFLWYKKNQL